MMPYSWLAVDEDDIMWGGGANRILFNKYMIKKFRENARYETPIALGN